MEYKLLVINPGSTSTKISLFVNETEKFEKSRFHDAPVLLQYPHVNDQVPFRYQVILDMLAEEGVDPAEIDVFVGRGGSACTQPSGVTVIAMEFDKVPEYHPRSYYPQSTCDRDWAKGNKI